MPQRKLEKAEWNGYFDRLSEKLAAGKAEAELRSLKVGDRVAIESVPLQGLSYDPKDDVFEVTAGASDHLISRPREIHLDEAPDGVRRIEVIDGDGTRQVIELAAPLPVSTA